MQGKGRFELYREFTEFVSNDVQRERRKLNRRMIYVLFWCFIAPAFLTLILLVLIRLGVLPWRTKAIADAMLIIFPVLYGVYVLGSEVLLEIPAVLKRGGLSATLSHSVRETEQRMKTCEDLRRAVHADSDQWHWIISNFTIELERFLYRIRFLTGMAGVVFFLILQGVDLLADPDAAIPVVSHPATGLVLVPAEWTQYMGLLIFLVLFYLSGTQTYHSLKRYRECAELVVADLVEAER